MSWMPLTIFWALMLFAYYLADQLDKQEERERRQQDNARATR